MPCQRNGVERGGDPGPFRHKGISGGVKIIVVVGKMQDVDWDPQPYKDLIAGLENTLKERGVDAQRLRFVPISSASGDNLLDLSRKSPWYVL